jgi:hypothetical protein
MPSVTAFTTQEEIRVQRAISERASPFGHPRFPFSRQLTRLRMFSMLL